MSTWADFALRLESVALVEVVEGRRRSAAGPNRPDQLAKTDMARGQAKSQTLAQSMGQSMAQSMGQGQAQTQGQA